MTVITIRMFFTSFNLKHYTGSSSGVLDGDLPTITLDLSSVNGDLNTTNITLFSNLTKCFLIPSILLGKYRTSS